MRERLIELIIQSVNGCARNWAITIADYLLTNGVVALPCNIGDTVFVIPTKENSRKEITPMICLGFMIDEPCNTANCLDEKNKLYQPSFDMFGKSVFLTKEETEAALERSK